MEVTARERIHHIIDLCSDICDKGVYTASVDIAPRRESICVYFYKGERAGGPSWLWTCYYAGELEDWSHDTTFTFDGLKENLLKVLYLEGEYAEDYQRSDVEDDAERDGGAAGDDSQPEGEDSGA